MAAHGGDGALGHGDHPEQGVGSKGGEQNERGAGEHGAQVLGLAHLAQRGGGDGKDGGDRELGEDDHHPDLDQAPAPVRELGPDPRRHHEGHEGQANVDPRLADDQLQPHQERACHRGDSRNELEDGGTASVPVSA